MTTTAPDECPSPDAVQAFLGARLSDGERLLMEQHLDVCRSCGRLVADLLASLESSSTGRASPGPGSVTAALGGAEDDQPSDIGIGQKVDRFLIVGTAGQGGMGKIFVALDPTLDRRIALKFLARRGEDEQARARLVAEASAMAKLSHPNVVAVYDVGVHQREPWLAMELVEGVNLAIWAGQRRRSLREIVAVMVAVARGLGAAHAAGIIHRDVKPQNVLVAGDRVLVTDFGLSVSPGSLPRMGIAGTPGFMAPEQLSGEKVDARTDVFGFCATLYYLLAGVVPFTGDSLGELWTTMHAGRIQPPAPGRKIPARIERLIRQGLAADPHVRPASVDDVARVLLADPGARVRRLLVAGAAAVITVAAFWGGARLTAIPERRCRAGSAAIDSAWSQPERVALRARHGSGVQREAWSILESRLDRYKQAWLDVHGQTCAATYSEHRQSAQALDLRMSCLEARRLALGSFVSALQTASPAQVVSAAGVPLASPSDCDLTGRALSRPLPGDPSARAQITQVNADLGRADAAMALGDLTAAARTAEAALTSARRIGHEPLLARALYITGMVERKRGTASASGAGPPAGLDRAVALQEEAFRAAERGGDDAGRAASARELVHLYTLRDRYREAELWAGVAAAVLNRMGDPPSEQANLSLAVGWLKWNLNRTDEAAAAFNQAVELNRKVRGPKDPQTAVAFTASCESFVDSAAMVACFEKALELSRQALGPRHPDLAAVYNNMSGAFTHTPATTSRGCALLVKAKAILDPVVAPGHDLRVKVLSNLAYCRQLEKRMDEARALYAEALSLVPGPSVERAHIRQGFALLHLDTGAYPMAERYQRLALEERRQLLGRSNNRVVTSAMNLADILLVQARPRLALAVLEETLADCQKAERKPQNFLLLRGLRAEALRALRRYHTAAAEFQSVLAEQVKGKEPEIDVGATLRGLGRTQLGLGQRTAAVSSLERSLALQPAGSVLASERATTALALAAALAAPGSGKASMTAGESRRKACSLASDAFDELHDDGGVQSQLRRQARDFLRRQRCAQRARQPGRA